MPRRKVEDNKIASPELYAIVMKKYPQWNITLKEFRVIIEQFAEVVKERLFRGENVTLGRFGTLTMKRETVKIRVDEQGRIRGQKDWKATNEKRKTMTEEQIANREHHVYRTNTFYFKPVFYGGLIPGVAFWYFKGATHSFERQISKHEHILELNAKHLK